MYLQFYLIILMDLLPADAAGVDGGRGGVAGVEDDWLVRGIHGVPTQGSGARWRGHAGGPHRRRGTAASRGMLTWVGGAGAPE